MSTVSNTQNISSFYGVPANPLGGKASVVALALGALAVGVALLYGRGNNQPIQYREATYDPPNNYPFETYQQVEEKVNKTNEIELTRMRSSPEKIKEMEEQNLLSPLSLYIEDEHGNTRKQEPMERLLGNGGCKSAIQLSEGKALLIPTKDTVAWPRIVEEEVQMSKFLQQIGLLGVQLQKVKVFPEKDSEHCIPAYVTDSFDHLKEKNIYIIDIKNSKSSTWVGDNKLFNSIADAEHPENWKPFIDLLIKDIAKLVHYQLPVRGDSFNVAIVGGQDGYKIRYFGFDYTKLFEKTLIPIVKERKSSQVDQGNQKQLLTKINRALSNAIKGTEKQFLTNIKQALKNAIEQVLFPEYQERWVLPREAYGIIDRLNDTYAREILKEVYVLQEAEVE